LPARHNRRGEVIGRIDRARDALQDVLSLHIEALDFMADVELGRLSPRFQAKARLMVILERDRRVDARPSKEDEGRAARARTHDKLGDQAEQSQW